MPDAFEPSFALGSQRVRPGCKEQIEFWLSLAITEQWGGVAPKFVQLTNDVVFADLWRRSDLSVRHRSLVTITALAAMGDADQLDLYLHRAIESGLTRAQIAEALTHLSFYAGWPKATQAMAVVARTLGK